MSYQGVYRAIVADNNDPEGLFRLRLRIPSLTGQSVTTWAWPMARFDVVEIPPVGTGVFAMFEGGDVSFPLWTGSFANPNPPAAPGGGGGGSAYRSYIGNGILTTIPVTHNLGSEDVTVEVREAAGLKRFVEVESRVTDANTVTFYFDTAPADSAYRVTITGYNADNPTPPQVVNEYVRKDGTIPFTQPQYGVTPTASLHLATKGYVDTKAVTTFSATAPTSPREGDLWVDEGNPKNGAYPCYLWDVSSNAWKQVGSSNGKEIEIATAEPTDPDISLWVDTDESGGWTPVAVSSTQPASTSVELWVDPTQDGGDGWDLLDTRYTRRDLFPGRNRIINGDFSVNQRAFTSATTDSTFGFDRWLLEKVGGTATYSSETATLGDLPESASKYARIVTTGQSAAADFADLSQKIESVRTLSGKTATVSFWARAASGTPKVAVELQQAFGTGGSPSAVVNTYAGQVTLSTSWARYSVTVAVPSITGKTLGTDGTDRLTLRMFTSAGSGFNTRTGSLGIQNVTIDFWGVQVEEGSYATPFEQKTYADELMDCQRYYYRSVGAAQYNRFGGGPASNNSVFAEISHPVPMRAAPVPSISAAADFACWDGGTNTTVTSIVADQSGHMNSSINVGGSFTLNRYYSLTAVSTSAWIAFSAEL